MLLSRYSNFDTIMLMGFEQGYELITKAYEKREEEKAWQMWLTLYPGMLLNTFEFKPFSLYFKELRQSISKRPTEEIIAEAEEITKRINDQKHKMQTPCLLKNNVLKRL